MKLEPDGYDRMLAYLGTVGPSFVVAKIEEVNGVQLYTLATTSGQVINDNLKNVLLGIEPTVAAQPQTALGNVDVKQFNLLITFEHYFVRALRTDLNYYLALMF